MNKREYLKYFAYTCIALQILVVFLLETFPFQDLPQHLTYAKILKDFSSNTLFQEYYQHSKVFNSYHIPYYFMVALQFIFSTIWSFKIIFLLNWLLLSFSIWKLRESHFGTESFHISIILGTVLIWHGSFFMGFLNYSLAIPFAILGLTLCQRYFEKKSLALKPFVILISAVLIISSLLHVFATGMIALLLAIYLLSLKKYKEMSLGLLFCLCLVLLFGGFLFQKGGGHFYIPAHPFRGSYGFEFINNLFNLKWSYPPTMINYIAWNLFGPLPVLITIPAFFIGGFYFLRHFCFLRTHCPLLKTALLFFIISMFLPWGLYRPTEITFINFRLLTVASILLFALFPKDYFHFNKQHLLFPSLLVFKLFTIFIILISFQIETSNLFKMIKQIPKSKKLHTIIYENEVPYLAKMFRATHFMPMYYMVLQDGITTQFWAGYTKHLPIAYRENRSLPNGGDWQPYNTSTTHVKQYDYHLIREPKHAGHSKYKSIQSFLMNEFQEKARYKDWVLYARKVID